MYTHGSVYKEITEYDQSRHYHIHRSDGRGEEPKGRIDDEPPVCVACNNSNTFHSLAALYVCYVCMLWRTDGSLPASCWSSTHNIHTGGEEEDLHDLHKPQIRPTYTLILRPAPPRPCLQSSMTTFGSKSKPPRESPSTGSCLDLNRPSREQQQNHDSLQPPQLHCRE